MVNLKLAFRTLFKAPFVTAVAILSLALGIGANAAIFSLFNQMLLRSLPVADPGGLVNLSAPGPKAGSTSCNQAGPCQDVFSYAMYRDLERVQNVFAGMAAHRIFSANFAYRGQTLNGDGMYVSGSYFPVLGIQPAHGRLLTPQDDAKAGESAVVVLSHSYWLARFDGSPKVLDETLIINGQPMTIVGVAPPDFTGTTLGGRPQVFVPVTMRSVLEQNWNPSQFSNRRNYWIYVFARLKPGTTIDAAKAQLNVQYQAILNDVEAPLQRGMSDETLKRFRARQLLIEEGSRGQSTVDTEARTPLMVLLAVTGLVLLIAAANIANLLLARAAARSSEMAIRLSIGASRGQLIRQLLTESVILAVLGGLAGLLVARWTLDLIASILPAEAVESLKLTIDTPVLLFGAVLTIGTGLLFGMFPALHSTRPDLLPTLKGQAGQPSGAKAASRFRATLATIQIAISMALLVCAGLFTKSLMNVSRIDLGLDVNNLLTFGVSPELNGYTPEKSKQIFAQIEQQLAALPGVSSVSGAIVPALAGSAWGNDVAVEGFRAGPDTDSNSRFNEVGPDYFKTMGIRLLAGREFTDADTLGAPKVAIVNESFARKFNLGQGAQVIGKRIGSETGSSSPLDTEIVGLAQDAKYNGVRDAIPPIFFVPYRQDRRLGFLNFYVRTSLEPEQLVQNVQKVVTSIDPTLPVENVRTMEQQVRENVFLDRMISTMSAGFAILATILASIGLYGVLAYTVAQRTREIGLRMALGAAPGRVRMMVLRQVAIMTLIGGVIGLTLALWAGRTARSLLFNMAPTDPVVLIVSVVLLGFVALGAGFLPAHRASRIDPMRALRYE
jgi:predicted permease